MFKLVWALGWIVNGVPAIQKMPPSEPMSIEDCRTLIAADVHRMHDWLRGALGAPLTFPVAVFGECEPVQQDATQKVE
jgi:hypothetical protein